MKIKALIIEDESPARKTLHSYINRYFPQITVVGETGDIESARKLINETSHDIIFLDVQLEDGLGITLLEQIDKLGSRIIFTTAFNQYAFTAFKHKAFGYLLKPINPIDFKEILGRVVKDVMVPSIDSVKIKIPVSDGFKYVFSNEIVRCESESNYTRMYFSDKSSTLISKTLKLFEEQLNHRTGFIRIHQSHLVNSVFIDQKHLKTNKIVLLNKKELPISRSRKDSVHETLERFWQSKSMGS